MSDYFNEEALENAEGGLEDSNSLESIKMAFANIASPDGMFGNVPNGEQAAAVLASAAFTMLEQLERAGVSIVDMVNDARDAAETVRETEDSAFCEVTNHNWESPPVGPREFDTMMFDAPWPEY